MQPGPRPPRFLRYDELKSSGHAPFTRQHLGRLEKRGLFPKRVRLGPNTVAWREDELLDWAEERSSERGRAG
jgi:prophage regulatory protein